MRGRRSSASLLLAVAVAVVGLVPRVGYVPAHPEATAPLHHLVGLPRLALHGSFAAVLRVERTRSRRTRRLLKGLMTSDLEPAVP